MKRTDPQRALYAFAHDLQHKLATYENPRQTLAWGITCLGKLQRRIEAEDSMNGRQLGTELPELAEDET